MIPAARLSAAIEVFADIAARRRPSADALKDWGLSHRFAGSSDRAAIAGLVYDALRRRSSCAWLMRDDSARAVLLGMLRLQRGRSLDEVERLCSGERFAPPPLDDAERARMADARLEDAPPHVRADVPEWLYPKLEAAFGEETIAELQALAHRAPLDIRANALKTSREALGEALAHLSPAATPHAPHGLRIATSEDGRGPSLQSEPEFLHGDFEIQDEGSQLAAALAGARPGEQVVDLCAGGGGKTLALAAAMGNHGQIFATDSDPRRLAPIHDRLKRAGARDVQVRTPRGRSDAVADLDGKADLVLVDAPCTGSGTWRRNPDAKWRLRPGSLEIRLREQETVLARAARLPRPGGRIAYVTCSILPDENDGAVKAICERRPELAPFGLDAVLANAPSLPATKIRATEFGLQMTPARTGTDGFYVALLGAR